MFSASRKTNLSADVHTFVMIRNILSHTDITAPTEEHAKKL